jgi:mannose-6-phosphate isomerase-like protein (cupin superfamily)
MGVIKHSEQPWQERRPGSRLQLIVDPGGGVTGLGLLNQECLPGVGAPSHTHEFEEVLTIVDGTAEIWIDHQRQIVGPGSSVFVPTGAIHGFRNVGNGTFKLYVVIAALELLATFLEPQTTR